MVTSRAVVGSSAKINRGSQIKAMATITRWRIPPLNWWGYWDSLRWGSGIPTNFKNSRQRFCASPAFIFRCISSASVS